jgi:hypothetical protein
MQVRPGVPLDHVGWVAQALVDYQPDVIVNIGDFWDYPSLSTHDKPGSLALEGARYEEDTLIGCDAFNTLSAPLNLEIKRQSRNKKRWKPELHFAFGNHEDRVTRAANADPKMSGSLSLRHCTTPGWQRHDFLSRFWVDQIVFSHYFQNQNSKFPIAGTIDNRLTRIGESFVQGHQQGFLYGSRVYPTGRMRHGLVAGSCYLHAENYKGAQGNSHFRGIVVLNEVSAGNYCVMPLTLSYLCRRYEKMDLLPYMQKYYKKQNWDHLRV